MILDPKIKVSTAPTTEPITLTEAKRHLRIYDSGYDDEIKVSINPETQTGTIIGDGVDVLGTTSSVVISVGSVDAGATLNVTIEESDDDATYTTWGTVDEIDDTGADEIYTTAYTGVKQYIRTKAVVADGDITFGANVSMIAGDPADNTELSMMITAARQYAEEHIRRALAPQTIKYYLDKFPSKYDYIELPRPPLTSVTSVIYTDYNDVATTMVENTDYIVDDESPIGRIVLPYNESWPTDTLHPVNPIVITYEAGYSSLPETLKLILLYHVGLLRKYRDTSVPYEDDKALKKMLDFWRLGGWN